MNVESVGPPSLSMPPTIITEPARSMVAVRMAGSTSSVFGFVTAASWLSRPPTTRISPVGSATALPNARGCCSLANDVQWMTAPPASGALTHARAPTSAASERTDASRVTARRVTVWSGGSLDGEGHPGRRDPLTAEPGDALLHQIDLQLV